MVVEVLNLNIVVLQVLNALLVQPLVIKAHTDGGSGTNLSTIQKFTHWHHKPNLVVIPTYPRQCSIMNDAFKIKINL